MRKEGIAKIIGQSLKDTGFGKVSIIGTDYKGEYFKGFLGDESVTIEVVPQKFEFRENFQGNREIACKIRELAKMEMDVTL